MAPPPVASDRLARVLDGIVAPVGLVVEAVDIATVGRRRVVRVVVDLPPEVTGSADLDTVASAGQLVGSELDRLDVAGELPEMAESIGTGGYALEVTTPGVDRPLTERRHWMRARTRLVTVTTTAGGSVAGRLVDVDDDGLHVQTGGRVETLPWPQVRRGRMEVELRRRDQGEG